MKCFNHPERDSVGMCRNCSKALCHDCAVSTSSGLSCKGACEKALARGGEVMARMASRTTMMRKLSGYYALVMGIVFIGLSFYIGGSGLIRYLIPVVGIGLLIWGIVLIRKARSVNSSK